MRIVGVDPGLTVTGIGVIEVVGEGCIHIHHCTLRPRPEWSTGRLVAIRDAVRDAALEWEVNSGAVETGFVGLNARSSMALGEARAAALLGLADAGIPIHEYSPALVKQTVASYGRSDKSQVAEMVRLQLGLQATPSPADAADALAVALTHWAQTRLAALEQRTQK